MITVSALLWMLGTTEIIIIAIVILLLFGGSKIPQLMKGIGQGIREFKKETKGVDDIKKGVVEEVKNVIK